MIRHLVFALLLVAASAIAQAGPFRIGVHYFPGWKDNQSGAAYPLPWDKIKPYPEREPMLGWYREGEVAVMSQQLAWMKEYGIDYVVFNWFWSRDNVPILAHALNAFLQAPDKHGMQFSILWANHTDYVFSREQFETMFRFWAQRYMFRDDYLKIDGMPVVFVLSAEILNRNAAKIAMTSKELIELADQVFRSAGLKGVRFMGGVGANGQGFDYSETSKYAGFFAYNYYGPATFRFGDGRQVAHNYREWDQGYRDHWSWMLRNSSGYFIVPMSVGWDKRPWGGSRDPEQDKCVSTPEQFEAHLMAAREAMRKYPDKTRDMGVICCWNEFGEGSYIEPTKKYGFDFLERVRNVFGPQ